MQITVPQDEACLGGSTVVLPPVNMIRDAISVRMDQGAVFNWIGRNI